MYNIPSGLKTPVAEPSDLNLFPGTNMVERKKTSAKNHPVHHGTCRYNGNLAPLFSLLKFEAQGYPVLN